MTIKVRLLTRVTELSIMLGLAMLLGCTSIPTMVPDMAMQQAHPVKLNGANGELSAKQSKAILTKLPASGGQ